VSQNRSRRGLEVWQVLAAWKSILGGSAPMLSIEVTRECPLSCPGCYAYGDGHLGGAINLRNLSDYRGNELADGIVGLVKKHRPLHVSLVGGEPLVRHRELSRVLPILSKMNVHSMVVTSAVIPIPREWMNIPRVRVTISVDGLPEHHDMRRKPATYERILKNIAGCQVNMHGTITRPMLERAGYLEEYISFWDARPEVLRIWISLYTPQKDEHTPEMLTRAERDRVAKELPALRKRYPKLLANEGISQAIRVPPANPAECTFSRMSTNYSADLLTRVEPCIFGGNPDCSQCGCAISSGLHWFNNFRLAGVVNLGDIARISVAIGSSIGRHRKGYSTHERWTAKPATGLVQIGQSDPPPTKAA
jgi:sulfatase maturation enzyme AslB (radical SAM superfamily)